MLIESGLDPLTVKTLMGHASITETYDTYEHLYPSQDQERAMDAVAASIIGRSRSAHGPPEGGKAQAKAPHWPVSRLVGQLTRHSPLITL